GRAGGITFSGGRTALGLSTLGRPARGIGAETQPDARRGGSAGRSSFSSNLPPASSGKVNETAIASSTAGNEDGPPSHGPAAATGAVSAACAAASAWASLAGRQAVAKARPPTMVIVSPNAVARRITSPPPSGGHFQ